jgi:hypothetical protein
VIGKRNDIEKRYMEVKESTKYVRGCKSEKREWRVLKDDEKVLWNR